MCIKLYTKLHACQHLCVIHTYDTRLSSYAVRFRASDEVTEGHGIAIVANVSAMVQVVATISRE